MSQHDLDIANQGFPATRADINNALQALGSSNSGATAPSTTYANQLWYDTANNIIKIRNEDNDAWISLFTLDQTNDNIEALTVDGTITADAVTSSGDLTVDTDTLFVDASADKVGINEATPSLADLEIYNGTTAGATMLALVGESNNTGDTSGYTVRNSILFGGQATTDTRSRIDGVHNRAAALGGEIVFNTCTTAGSLTEKARFLANGGLTFNGDTAAANALDDYEEASWTGTLTGTTGNPSTTVTATGKYTKIGRLVHVECVFNNVTTTGASGAVGVSGLPFSADTANRAHGTATCFNFDFPSGKTSLTCEISGTNVFFGLAGDDTGWGDLQHSAGTGRYLHFAITYNT